MNDHALAALSAAVYVPKRRIGFLIMPSQLISRQVLSRAVDMVSRRRFANRLFGQRAMHVSDIFDKIKTEEMNTQLRQQACARDSFQAFHFKRQRIRAQLLSVTPRTLLRPRCGGAGFVHG